MPRPLVMGVVNVTPDSFSDGGRYVEPPAAVALFQIENREVADDPVHDADAGERKAAFGNDLG